MSDNNNKITQQSAFPRRDFLKYSAAAAAVAGAFSMGLPFGAMAAEATPKPGGVLRLGLATIPVQPDADQADDEPAKTEDFRRVQRHNRIREGYLNYA